jgi:hypothetical protein
MENSPFSINQLKRFISFLFQRELEILCLKVKAPNLLKYFYICFLPGAIYDHLVTLYAEA